ncbi:PREDICTED: N-acetylglucosamine-6-sulfatase-like [Branchiostoma belcheri]|uniref:N-acetylglucosamine-6-sulfatase-like n=1 Tax=Branchiostoma belcheri TaxID=7741 RepID=A0A6P4YJ37_BRABE|nr:PREDICTED: N-acetylglucosamine-6-sulfatase-like [Branchiostoma belcheri]
MAGGTMLGVCLPVFLCCCVLVVQGTTAPRPNIVFILTDDQDVVLEGMFVSSPLCCPSRSSILTGKYVHNHWAVNNSVDGDCSSKAWQDGPEKSTFATQVKTAGYRTFFAGKYLNQYGFPSTGGPAHIPPGWDWWIGLIGNSRYYDYSLSVNGTKQKHGKQYSKDYLTDVIKNQSLHFLDTVGATPDPFFMMLSTPAAHSPFDSAPQYEQDFVDWKAPRGGSYNVHGKDKHWLLRFAPSPMKETSVQWADNIFRKRMRTLLSVEDLVQAVMSKLEDKDLLSNTYVIFSSDNGYHYGQFSLPEDKRQLYEFDIRVPLMVRGPGIKSGQTITAPVMNIDLMPTIIEMARGKTPLDVDGRSLMPLLLSTQVETGAPSWRLDLLVEHQGEWALHAWPKYNCPHWWTLVTGCVPDCVCEDSYNNTYSCVRTLSSRADLMYCEFQDNENFKEFYNLEKDPHQLNNAINTTDPNVVKFMSKRLKELVTCSGKTCNRSEQILVT